MSDLAAGLVDALVDAGVDTVLGIPGTHNLPLFAALRERGVRVVVPRHEQGAAYAADAYSRVSGRLGVVVTTTGPGALNAAAGLAQAWSDSSPVLLVAPGMPTTKPQASTGMLHEMRDQFAAMSACADRGVVARTPEQAGAAVAGVLAQARDGRPRPWYVELPLDLLAAPPQGLSGSVAPDPDAAVPPGLDEHELDLVGRAAQLLSTAQRPVIVAGGGARRTAEDLTGLAQVLGAAVVTSVNGRGVVPENHPASLGATLHLASTHALLAQADAVLVVGCELAESDTWSPTPLPLADRVIRIDVDRGMAGVNLDGPPALLLSGRAERLLPALLVRVRAALSGAGSTGGAGGVRDRDPWARRADTSHAERPWAGLLAGLRAALPATAVVVADNAKAAYHGAQTGLRVEQPSSYLFPTGFGTLGWAVPAAAGAVLGDPSRPVLALTGDGGLQFSVAELATLRDLHVGVPVVVVDNGGYGEIRDQMIERGDEPVAVDLAPPTWPELAAAFGCAFTGIAAPSDEPACADEVAAAVTAAFDRDRPTLIVVREGAPR